MPKPTAVTNVMNFYADLDAAQRAVFRRRIGAFEAALSGEGFEAAPAPTAGAGKKNGKKPAAAPAPSAAEAKS